MPVPKLKSEFCLVINARYTLLRIKLATKFGNKLFNISFPFLFFVITVTFLKNIHQSPCSPVPRLAGVVLNWFQNPHWLSWSVRYRPAASHLWPRDVRCPWSVSSGRRRCPDLTELLDIQDAANTSKNNPDRFVQCYLFSDISTNLWAHCWPCFEFQTWSLFFFFKTRSNLFPFFKFWGTPVQWPLKHVTFSRQN